MSQHTPGRWVVARQFDGKGFIIIEMGKVLCKGVQGGVVIEVDLSENEAEEMCAAHNAGLVPMEMKQ